MTATTLSTNPLPRVPTMVGGVGLVLLILLAVFKFKEVSFGDHPPSPPSLLTLKTQHIVRRAAAWMYLFDGTNIIAQSYGKVSTPPENYAPSFTRKSPRTDQISHRQMGIPLRSSPQTIVMCSFPQKSTFARLIVRRIRSYPSKRHRNR